MENLKYQQVSDCEAKNEWKAEVNFEPHRRTERNLNEEKEINRNWERSRVSQPFICESEKMKFCWVKSLVEEKSLKTPDLEAFHLWTFYFVYVKFFVWSNVSRAAQKTIFDNFFLRNSQLGMENLGFELSNVCVKSLDMMLIFGKTFLKAFHL